MLLFKFLQICDVISKEGQNKIINYVTTPADSEGWDSTDTGKYQYLSI